MILPDNFTVPDFVLEMVRVAPEQWTAPTDSATAKGQLADLNKSLLNPAVLMVMCDLVLQLSAAEHDIDSHRFAGLHDLVNQQQLIGEKRGLRQFFTKLQQIHAELVTVSNQV